VSLRHSVAIARQDARVFRRDPLFVVVFTVMPLIVMAFVKPAFRDTLVAHGAAGANGAEQAVPGLAVMFSFFLVGQAGWGVFREHGWNTWLRLRASWASTPDIVAGKAVFPLCMFAVQLTVLFGIGGVLFGLHVRGSYAALALVALAMAVFLAAVSLALVAVCRTVMQLNAVATIGAMALAGVGGALAPIASLPGWVRAIAPGTPSYWAMRGFRSVTLDGAGVGGVMLPVVVLLAFAAGCAAITVARFRVDETKVSWA